MRYSSPIFFTHSKPVWVDDLEELGNKIMFGPDIRDFWVKVQPSKRGGGEYSFVQGGGQSGVEPQSTLYFEYHSACPLVRIRTPPPPL
jgi:hypothetical protein